MVKWNAGRLEARGSDYTHLEESKWGYPAAVAKQFLTGENIKGLITCFTDKVHWR